LRPARNIIRELQALGACVRRNGDRLILRAGSHPIPQSLVEQARDAKQDILALLGPGGALTPPSQNALTPPSQNSISPTTKNPVAVLGKFTPETRGNADGFLTPPVGGLSGGLSGGLRSENRGGLSEQEGLAALAEDASERESEEFRHFHTNEPTPNLSASAETEPETPKTATPNEVLAALAKAQESCDVQGVFSPKAATHSVVLGPPKTAKAPNPADAKSYETSGSATINYQPLPLCCECGFPINEKLETWWGAERCHRACGEAAFQREKARGAYLRAKGTA